MDQTVQPQLTSADGAALSGLLNGLIAGDGARFPGAHGLAALAHTAGADVHLPGAAVRHCPVLVDAVRGRRRLCG